MEINVPESIKSEIRAGVPTPRPMLLFLLVKRQSEWMDNGKVYMHTELAAGTA